MEFLAGLYTLLLVTICLLLAAVLWKLNKPRNGGDYEELKRWMQQQLDAQAKDFAARQAAMAEQNYTAIRSVSETLQTSVQSMSTTLAQGQSGQQLSVRRASDTASPPLWQGQIGFRRLSKRDRTAQVWRDQVVEVDIGQDGQNQAVHRVEGGLAHGDISPPGQVVEQIGQRFQAPFRGKRRPPAPFPAYPRPPPHRMDQQEAGSVVC